MNNDLLQLKNELKVELVDNILTYWKKNTVDTENGGFIGSINGSEEIIKDAPKGLVLNARILWTFASAYRIFGNTDDLELATRSYKYVTQNFFDTKFGGVYWEIDYKGKPLNTRKQIYGLSFTMYGLIEYYRITGKKEALDLSINLFNLIEQHSFDTEENGYIEAFSREWHKMEDYRLSDIDANESKTMNTHLHILEAYTNLYRVWKDERLKTQLKNLIHLFIDKFINENYNLNLFFDDYWNLHSDEISYGHDIECSWLLHEAAEVFGDKALIKKVADIAYKMAIRNLKGLDIDGGLMNEEHPSKNTLDTDKHWWPQAEALVGYYNVYQLSGETRFLEKTKQSWNFIKKYVVDKENGEWYGRLSKDREPIMGDEKVGFWKCPYHNGRACMELFERINKTN